MKGGNRDKPKKEFDEALLEVRRVTRVTTGGRRMSFRATVLIGNKKGKIGLGVSKGADVSIAVKKASGEAYKNMFDVPLTKAFTVPYPVTTKYKSCFVKLLPATRGTGLKAGSSIRAVLELAGYENILSKMIGSNNKLNNAMATIKALCAYKHADYFSKLCAERTIIKADESKDIDMEEVVKKTIGKNAVVDIEPEISEDNKVISEDKKDVEVKNDKKGEKDEKIVEEEVMSETEGIGVEPVEEVELLKKVELVKEKKVDAPQAPVVATQAKATQAKATQAKAIQAKATQAKAVKAKSTKTKDK